MKPDAEHQKDDADLGQFGGKALVGDEARRERTNRDAREQIADDRRNAKPLSQGAKDERQGEANDNGGDQRRIVRHREANLRSFEERTAVQTERGSAECAPSWRWVQKSGLQYTEQFWPAGAAQVTAARTFPRLER